MFDTHTFCSVCVFLSPSLSLSPLPYLSVPLSLPYTKNLQLYLKPVVDMLLRYFHGCTVQGRTFYPLLAWLINDLPGLAEALLAKNYPGYFGTCVQCDLRGLNITELNTTVYLYAVMDTLRGLQCRAWWEIRVMRNENCIFHNSAFSAKIQTSPKQHPTASRKSFANPMPLNGSFFPHPNVTPFPPRFANVRNIYYHNT